MPAVNFKVRWPDGQETNGYSPSTLIYQYLQAGSSCSVEEFLTRAEAALSAASERVRELKGFYCSSAMDTLAILRQQARRYGGNEPVLVLDMHTQHSGQVLAR
nr:MULTISPECIES: MSMEG_0570 family nitrogen starvation response protein [unclassified Pseudomonas]